MKNDSCATYITIFRSKKLFCLDHLRSVESTIKQNIGNGSNINTKIVIALQTLAPCFRFFFLAWNTRSLMVVAVKNVTGLKILQSFKICFLFQFFVRKTSWIHLQFLSKMSNWIQFRSMRLEFACEFLCKQINYKEYFYSTLVINS